MRTNYQNPICTFIPTDSADIVRTSDIKSVEYIQDNEQKGDFNDIFKLV